jgi:hypothetical protein
MLSQSAMIGAPFAVGLLMTCGLADAALAAQCSQLFAWNTNIDRSAVARAGRRGLRRRSPPIAPPSWKEPANACRSIGPRASAAKALP